jgi:hypothetical protein
VHGNNKISLNFFMKKKINSAGIMNESMDCEVCKKPAQLICFCKEVVICQTCIGIHILSDKSLAHKPVPLSDESVNLLKSSIAQIRESEAKILEVAATRNELLEVAKQKLADELMEVNEFKSNGAEKIDALHAKISDLLNKTFNYHKTLFTGICEEVQNLLRESLNSFKNNEERNHIVENLVSLGDKHKILNAKLLQNDIQIQEVQFETLFNGLLRYICNFNQAFLQFNEATIEEPAVSTTSEVAETLNSSFDRRSPERTPTEPSSPTKAEIEPQSRVHSYSCIQPPTRLSRSKLTPIKTANPSSDQMTVPKTTSFSSKIPVLSPRERLSEEKKLFEENRPFEVAPTRSSVPVTQPARSIIRTKSGGQKHMNKQKLLYYFRPNSTEVIIYDPCKDEQEKVTLNSQDLFLEGSSYCITADGFVYVTGGDGPSKNVAMYSHSGTEYAVLPQMKTARSNHATVIYLDHLYAIGGTNGGPIKECERMSLVTKQWSKVGNLNVARDYHAACVHIGRLYVAGGPAVDSIETYNQVNGKFSLLRVRLQGGGKTTMFSVSQKLMICHEMRITAFTTSNQDWSEWGTLPDINWWCPGSPVVTENAVYFIRNGEVWKLNLEQGNAEPVAILIC